LTEIVRDAVDVWKDIQRDRYRVVVETEPNKKDSTGWTSPCSNQPAQNSPPLNEEGLENICLFPKIRRIEPGVDSKPLIQGRAIFADSPILTCGIHERNEIQEEIQEEVIRRKAEEARKELETLERRNSNGNSRRNGGRHSRTGSLMSPSLGYSEGGLGFGNPAVIGITAAS
jgi:hypothetical protein